MPTTPDPSTYIFIPGVDPSGPFAGYASILLQMFQMGTLSPYYGIVICAPEPAPAVVGQPVGYPANWYAVNKRCIWYNLTDGFFYKYVEGTGWRLAANVPDNSITAAMLMDGIVGLGKLDPSGFSSGDVIYFDGATFVAGQIIDGINNGTLTLAKLVPGTEGQVLQTIGGIAQWNTLTIGGLIADHSLAFSKLVPGTALQLLRTNAAGDNVEGVSFASLLTAGVIPLTAVAPTGGTALYYLRANAGNTAVEFAAFPVILVKSSFTSSNTAIPAIAPNPGNTVIAHGLASIPLVVRPVWVCTTAEAGYVLNQEINYESLELGAGGSPAQYAPVCTYTVDATNITINWAGNGGAWLIAPLLYTAGTGANGFKQLTVANWALKFYLTKIA